MSKSMQCATRSSRSTKTFKRFKGLDPTPPGILCRLCKPNPWGQSTTPGNGQSASSGDGGSGTTMAAIIGGNGICHCIHVKELQDQANNIAQQVSLLQRGPDPIRSAWGPTFGERHAPNSETHGHGQPDTPIGDTSGAADMRLSSVPLPLDLREGLAALPMNTGPSSTSR